jgi:transcriptional regulator with XRE-family HTH domain
MSHSDAIKAARKRAGISQRELAKRAGINRRTVDRIERGMDPTVQQWCALVRIVDEGPATQRVAAFVEVWGEPSDT